MLYGFEISEYVIRKSQQWSNGLEVLNKLVFV